MAKPNQPIPVNHSPETRDPLPVIVIAVTEMSLLLPDMRVALSARVIAARTLGLAVAAAAFVSLAFLHLEGLLFIVFAALLVAAIWVAPTASALQRRATTSVPDSRVPN